MLKFTAKKRVSKSLKEMIENTIKTNKKYKSCYFWKNTGNAANRRSQEEHFTADNPHYQITTGKGIIKVEPTLDISCKNFYYSLNISFNDEKSTITRLKTLIK